MILLISTNSSIITLIELQTQRKTWIIKHLISKHIKALKQNQVVLEVIILLVIDSSSHNQSEKKLSRVKHTKRSLLQIKSENRISEGNVYNRNELFSHLIANIVLVLCFFMSVNFTFGPGKPTPSDPVSPDKPGGPGSP